MHAVSIYVEQLRVLPLSRGLDANEAEIAEEGGWSTVTQMLITGRSGCYRGSLHVFIHSRTC